MSGSGKAGLRDKVLGYVRAQELLRAGERVGVAVSGGADSTALLRILLELRGELGVILSVVHFNHKIRGADADADEQAVAELARAHGLEFHGASGDAPAHARRGRMSLETAGRELRYGFFRELLSGGVLDKVATAHTLDDQAETVLLRLVRGAGSRGLAGIHPQWAVAGRQPLAAGDQGIGSSGDQRHSAAGEGTRGAAIVRPLLAITRAEVERYLHALGQRWREDASNRDLAHARNRVRHVLLPLLEREFNPAIRQVLAEMAEVARAEEEFWAENLHARDFRGELPVELFQRMPLALQRRLVRRAAEAHGVRLDFEQVEAVRGLGRPGVGAMVELRCGMIAARERDAVVFRAAPPEPAVEYAYRVAVPGEVTIPELRSVFRVLRAGETPEPVYNREQLLDPHSLGSELQVRNWRPGDRFWPAHTKSPKKVKELLQERRISGTTRALWPVAVKRGVTGDELVWMRGFAVPERFAAAAGQGVVIVEERLR